MESRLSWLNEGLLRLAILAVLLVLAADGLVNTFFFTHPFWVDEWRIIYNLKTKNITGLWQGLDFMQQFPRAYLSCFKVFAQVFDYSYSALRLPSFIVGCCAIGLAWRLMRRMYPAGLLLQYLFPLIIASSVPFTKYFVQTKQYTMDMLLCLLAVWQLLELRRLLVTDGGAKPVRYALACASLAIAPFFSYTYAIAVAPLYLLAPLFALRGSAARPWQIMVPLLCGLCGIAAVYMADVRQLLADQGMKTFWKCNFSTSLGIGGILDNLFAAFAHAGSGYVFEIIFGVLGVAGFIKGIMNLPAMVQKTIPGIKDLAVAYATLMLSLVFLLFLAGKLPLGESRLNAFLIPSVALLIIDLLATPPRPVLQRIPSGIAVVLFLGVAGNIFTTIIGNYTEDTLPKEREIYFGMAAAIRKAEGLHLPILATPAVAWPYDDALNLPDTLHTVPGDWILKTHPAYHMALAIPVYAIPTAGGATAWMDTASLKPKGVVLCDGANYTVVSRKEF